MTHQAVTTIGAVVIAMTLAAHAQTRNPGHIDHTVRISGKVASLVALKLPAPGEALPKPGAPSRTADTVVRPGEAARPGEIPAPVSEKRDPDPNWLSLKATSVTMVDGSCSLP